jgi:hypothetical protein
MEDIMLQRYDISLDSGTNRLLIKEFAVFEKKSRKLDNYNPTEENYSLIHEESYDIDTIRNAVNTGRASLISELRSDDFFPIHFCVKIIADKVIELLDVDSATFSELFFDDTSLMSQ